MVFASGCGQDFLHGRIVAVFALASLLSAPLALAQYTTEPKAGADARRLEKPPLFEPAKLKVEIEKELTELRGSAEKDVAPAPAEITAEESESARQARSMLVHVLSAQLETLDRISRDERVRTAAEKAEREWTGFPQPPPYSYLLADDIHEQVATRRAAVDLLQSSRSAMQVETARFRARAEDADEKVRLAAEALERRAGGPDTHAPAARWRLEAARDRSKLANVLQATANLASRELDMRLAIAQAELRLSEQQLGALAGNMRLSKADLEGAKSRLDAARAQWAKDLQLAVTEAAKRARERERAAAELDSLRAAVAGRTASPEQRPLVLAEARFRAADAWSNSLTQQVRILTVLTTVYYERILEAWQWRYSALSEGHAGSREWARNQLDELVEYLKAWDSRSKTQQNEVHSAIQEQDKRILSGTDPVVLAYERDALDALRQLDQALERQQAILARRLARLQDWRADFAVVSKGRSLAELGGELYARAASLVRKIWDYELLTIEDKVEVGGQTLTTSRGVTVGKSIGALLLFLIALRLMIFLFVRLERLMVRRFGMNEQKAKMIRRWVNVFAIIVVLMITLNLARIPLTVFAFAGGALAIGVGFGMQTLIKNLIAGVIVLLERHVRVGDVIEVEGVTGTVTAVDVRSSTIRAFDGVESMIPNSSLLEQRVTNWTLTNAHVRRVVKIGVAYGSPARTVAQILEGCAMRHELVLRDPPPRVIFEDFGDNALVFALYFWINLSPSINSLQVMSDLRFMMDQEMREADIVFAFPQRDIHIDTTRPIKVELASPSASSAAEGVSRARPGRF
ncbi:MAG TPA: mechanosensitive ion channel domain-containing protein [Burkholderiales bacterium]|nr:mechanosensitive ion channel domain-containing protein [Burkholderiales bacterium]